MKRAALITVHGMGEASTRYADDLIAKVMKRLEPDEAAALAVQSVYYKASLKENQSRVWDACKLKDYQNIPNLRRFILFGFGDAAGLETRKDEPHSAYEDAQFVIATRMLAARETLGGNGPVVVIAQSLGGQVISNFIWDAQRSRDANAHPPRRPPNAGIWRPGAFLDRLGREPTDPEKAFMRGDTITCLLTTGCNIPIFIAAHKAAQVKPIAKPNDAFEWHNCYDPQDVLGWPLQPLGGGYETLAKDHRINAGGPLTSWNPLSHASYWRDRTVLDALVSQLRRTLRAPAPMPGHPAKRQSSRDPLAG